MPFILLCNRLLRYERDFGNFQKLRFAVQIDVSQAVVCGGKHGRSRHSTPSACALWSDTLGLNAGPAGSLPVRSEAWR